MTHTTTNQRSNDCADSHGELLPVFSSQGLTWVDPGQVPTLRFAPSLDTHASATTHSTPGAFNDALEQLSASLDASRAVLCIEAFGDGVAAHPRRRRPVQTRKPAMEDSGAVV